MSLPRGWRPVCLAAAAATVLAWPAAVASQVHFRRLDQVAGMVTHVFKVKVTGVKRSQEHHKLKGGKQGPVSAWHVTYECDVQEQLVGKTGRKQLTVRHATINPTGYDDSGKAVVGFSLILNGSGLEPGLEAGKSYFLCFAGFRDEDPAHHLLRAEKPEQKDQILRHVGEARAWRLLKKHHAAEMQNAGAAHYDAGRRCLLVTIGVKLFRVDGLGGGISVAPTAVNLPLKVNNLQVTDETVVLRFNDREVVSVHLSRFKPDPAAAPGEKASAKPR